MENQQLLFLIYMNRSGSTLFARELSRYSDTSVSIEGLDKRYIRYEPENFVINNRKELASWAEDLYWKDLKFRSWGIPRADLETKLAEKGFPLHFQDFLLTALSLYSGAAPHPRALIYKGNDASFFDNLDKSFKVYPGAKYIFVDRDPRAIYNSQKKAKDSFTKKPMNKDMVNFALRYKKNQKRIEHYSKREKYRNAFIRVFYESLITDKKKELRKTLEYLGCSDDRISETTEYYQAIPESQRHIHENLNQEIKKSRKAAWKRELSYDEIYFLEKAVKPQLIRNGYAPEQLSFKYVRKKLDMAKNLTRFFFKYQANSFLKQPLIKLRLRKIW